MVNNPPGKPSQNFGTRTWEIYTDSGLTNVASKSGSTYQLTSGTDYYILVKHTSGTNKWDTGNTATDVGTNGANLNFVFTQTQDTSGGGGVVPEPASLAVFGLMGLGGAVAKWRRKK